MDGDNYAVGTGAEEGKPRLGKGACLLIEGSGSFTCEIDAEHFSSKRVCDHDRGLWCEDVNPKSGEGGGSQTGGGEHCHCWANGQANEGFCEDESASHYKNSRACEAEAHCHWGVCTRMYTQHRIIQACTRARVHACIHTRMYACIHGCIHAHAHIILHP